MDETKIQDGTTGRLRRDPIEITFSLPQLAGGALAAATAAAIGAQLGVAGTIVGAAVASVVGGVAGTLYSAGLDRTHRKVSGVISRRRAVVVQPDLTLEEQTLPLPGGVPDPADTLVDLPAVTDGAPRRRRLGVWGTVAISTVAIFVLALVAISVVELGLGRALDGGSGTTVGQVVQPPQPSKSTTTPVASVSATPTPTPTPTVTVTETATASASASPTVTPTEPTASATPTASVTQTVALPATPQAGDTPTGP